MAFYSIRDLEKLTGIKAHTLRIWEKRYKLLEPRRTETNIRIYSDEDLRRILNIAVLNRNGIKISRIAELTIAEISARISELARQYDTETLIESLMVSMIELNEKNFNKVLARSFQQMGFEETILNLVYPFLEKVGMLWQTGTINPAQEHFASNLIRQKLILAIDKLPDHSRVSAKTMLLFLPEGEYHEIGLLFHYFLAKKNGHNVIYLGQSVPMNNLASIMLIKTVDLLLTRFSSTFNGTSITEYLSKLANLASGKTIYFSSYHELDHKTKFPPNIICIKDLQHFTKLISVL
jgi:DNA-binding transcriptional MerR regulator